VEESDVTFSKEFERAAEKALKRYEKGRYEKALELFERCLQIDSRGELFLYPYMARCKKVISAKSDSKNKKDMKNVKIQYVARLLAASSIVVGLHLFNQMRPDLEGNIFQFVAGIFRFTFRSFQNFFTVFLLLALVYGFWRLFSISEAVQTRWRCKLCGHFTSYVAPNEPTFGGLIGANFCRVCGRSYPMPDGHWDGWEGMDYMYCRHSVHEQEFYDEYSDLQGIRDSLQKKFFPEKA